MRVVTFTSDGTATISWTVDRDCVITTAQGVAGNGGVYSSDPSLTWANFSAAANSVVDEFRLWLYAGTGLNISLLKNQVIYLAPALGGGAVIGQLCLEDISAELQ
jgi:hypothetical protein